jgi:glycosyltransferase involved in cell wall biosynthesis
VAWFRDLYTDNPLYVEWSPWRSGFDRALERRVVGYADAVVTVYPETTELLRRRCARPGQLYRTIRNGYDEEIFAGARGRIEAERSDNKLVLLHGGTLAYYDRDGQTAHALLEGLRRWLDENPTAADALRLELVGKGATAYGERVAELCLEDVVTLEPAVPLHRITERQLAADILLVILEDSPTNRVITGGKIYECLRAGKPILGVMHPDSSAARLIEDLNAGSVAPYGDAAAIARTLDKLHAGVTSGGFAYGGPARDEFVRRTSFAALAAEHTALYTALLRARGLA